jgi:hypothetical protein
MPIGEGTSLGAAQGRIVIDLSDLQNVRVVTQRVGQEAERNLGRIGAGALQAQNGLGGLAGSLRGVAGALGIGLGAAAVSQVIRFGLEADRVATAFERQSVAAVNLAGSQQKLNELLNVYNQVTGGVIDRATALSDVTRLQAVGFADTTEELENFARAARGISVATGQQQDYVISQLQLAIANQSTMRLDQLGLGVSEVKNRIDELRASNKNLTTEMAYQDAVLGLAQEKFGALADSAEAQATGAEKAAKAWKDLRLEFGTGFGGDATNAFMEKLAENIQNATLAFQRLQDAIEGYKRSIDSIGRTGAFPIFNSFSVASGGSFAAQAPDTPPARGRTFAEGSIELMQEKIEALADIEQNSLDARADAIQQFGEQAASAERNYGKTIAREAEDFARQRLRAEQEFAESILDIREDAARREAESAEDLARVIGQARADSAERLADWEEDHNERLADIREDGAERLAELDERYQRDRERAARDHSDRIADAAGRLDAIAVAEAQKNYKRQEEDAKEAYDEQRTDLEEQLQERIDQENESYAERLEDEREALDKRIRQANEAAQRQLDDARENDALRIQDMTDDFEKRKILEDEDRATRLIRMAQDHQDQMDEMARQHALNLQQIADQEQEERDKVEEEFVKEMAALGVRTAAYVEKLRQKELEAEYAFDKWWAHVNGVLLGEYALQGSHPSMSDPYTNREAPRGNTTFSAGSIVINAAPEHDEEKIGEIVERRIINLLESAA